MGSSIPLKYFCDAEEYAKILFELSAQCDVMVEGEQALSFERNKLHLRESDLVLVGLRAGRDHRPHPCAYEESATARGTV
jgi:hypothetical protein